MQLNDKKHEEYADRLKRFQEMQDRELTLMNKTREDNRKLREQNQMLKNQLRDYLDK